MADCVDIPCLTHWLERLSVSSFLRNLHQRDAEVFESALSDPEAYIRALIRPEQAWLQLDSATLRGILRQRKRHLVMLLAALDYGCIAPKTSDLMTITGYLSDFAAMAIDVGLSCLMREQGFADHQGVVVLGMGKLGGRELNYSSDVDLIVLFDHAQLSRSDDKGDNHRRIQRVIRHLVLFLEAREAEGYIFRSDLRLRPDPSSMPLAVEIGAAVQYYESMGLAWERAAMLKARAVAGDISLADVFFKRIKPFIWRRSLDFASIEDIYAIRNRALKRQRAEQIDGINIKLIEGGIREIELFAQSLQLIWGGRAPSLQIKPTLVALDALVDADIIAADSRDQLRAAYIYYRRLEHAAQLLDDQQCHTLPATAETWQAFCALMNVQEADIRKAVAANLAMVRHICQPQMQTTETTQQSVAQVDSALDDQWLESKGYVDIHAVQQITERWMGGGYRVTASERARRLLAQLMPKLLRAIAATAAPDDALARMDKFLEALPAGVQLFSLFVATPKLLRHCADIMGNAPRMAEWLAQKPRLFEYLLHTSREPLPVLPLAVSGLEETLDDCRRLAHEIEFRTSVGFMAGKTSLAELFQQQSQAAAVIVSQTLRVLRHASSKLPRDGFAVIAMGKLGTQQLMPDSDLDLLFISKPSVDASNMLYVRLAQRLLSGLSVPTAEGKLYEVDVRLRPYGDSGALCQTLESVQKYYAEEAWLWEHYALSQARVLYADSNIQTDVAEWLHGLQTQKHDAASLQQAIGAMRPRITAAFPAQGPWDLKHSHGGLMDAGFVRQYLQMYLAPVQSGVIGAAYGDVLEQGAQAGLVDAQLAQAVTRAYDWMIMLQAGLRVSGGNKAVRIEDAPLGQQRLLSRLSGTENFTELESRLHESYRCVSELYAHLFVENFVKEEN